MVITVVCSLMERKLKLIMFFFSIYPVEVRYIEEGDDTCIENDHDGYIKDGCENEDGYRYLSLRLIKKKMKT